MTYSYSFVNWDRKKKLSLTVISKGAVQRDSKDTLNFIKWLEVNLAKDFFQVTF